MFVDNPDVPTPLGSAESALPIKGREEDAKSHAASAATNETCAASAGGLDVVKR
jgi:hypothetical protein